MNERLTEVVSEIKLLLQEFLVLLNDELKSFTPNEK